MIRSFACADTETLFLGTKVHGVSWEQVQKIARRKLIWLDTAETVNDLKAPPSNHLEALKGDRKGQHSIRVNDQFRICFIWRDDGPHEVEIVDYH